MDRILTRKNSPPILPTLSSVNLHVGNVGESTAMLISEDFTVLEMPLSLFPSDIRKGNILKFTIERNVHEEEVRKNEIIEMQKSIIKNQKMFDDYYKKIELFRQQQLKLFNASSKNGTDIQQTIDQVLQTINQNPKEETIESDKLKLKPKPVLDIKIDRVSNIKEKMKT